MIGAIVFAIILALLGGCVIIAPWLMRSETGRRACGKQEDEG
jgi:ABC-type branched-subunit amino acid transport system permease subunit